MARAKNGLSGAAIQSTSLCRGSSSSLIVSSGPSRPRGCMILPRGRIAHLAVGLDEDGRLLRISPLLRPMRAKNA